MPPSQDSPTSCPVKIVPLEPGRCRACGLCASVCPADVFEVDPSLAPTHRVTHAGRCILCGHCVAVCPEEILRHSRLPFQSFEKVPDTSHALAGPIETLFRARRTIRRFSTTPISRADIVSILEAGRHSPASTNTRNIQWLLLDDSKCILRLINFTTDYYLRLGRRIRNPLVKMGLYLTLGKRMVDAYDFRLPAIIDHFEKCRNGEDLVFYGAPIVGIASAPGMEHLALANINLALGHVLLLSQARGLGTLVSGYAMTALRRDRSIWNELDLPKSHHVGAVVAFGKPDVSFRLVPPRPPAKVKWIEG